jgi:hypothetical protein
MYAGGSQDAAERRRWTFSEMPLTDQVKKADYKTAQETEGINF